MLKKISLIYCMMFVGWTSSVSALWDLVEIKNLDIPQARGQGSFRLRERPDVENSFDLRDVLVGEITSQIPLSLDFESFDPTMPLASDIDFGISQRRVSFNYTAWNGEYRYDGVIDYQHRAQWIYEPDEITHANGQTKAILRMTIQLDGQEHRLQRDLEEHVAIYDHLIVPYNPPYVPGAYYNYYEGGAQQGRVTLRNDTDEDRLDIRLNDPVYTRVIHDCQDIPEIKKKGNTFIFSRPFLMGRETAPVEGYEGQYAVRGSLTEDVIARERARDPNHPLSLFSREKMVYVERNNHKMRIFIPQIDYLKWKKGFNNIGFIVASYNEHDPYEIYFNPKTFLKGMDHFRSSGLYVRVEKTQDQETWRKVGGEDKDAENYSFQVPKGESSFEVRLDLTKNLRKDSISHLWYSQLVTHLIIHSDFLENPERDDFVARFLHWKTLANVILEQKEGQPLFSGDLVMVQSLLQGLSQTAVHGERRELIHFSYEGSHSKKALVSEIYDHLYLNGLRELVLRNLNFRAGEVQNLLQKPLSSLKVLDLSQSEFSGGDNDIDHVITCLTRFPALESLRLKGIRHGGGTPPFVSLLRERFKDSLQNLKELDLSDNNISEGSMRVLVGDLPTRLVSLKLAGNNTLGIGTQELAERLRDCRELEVLHLSNGGDYAPLSSIFQHASKIKSLSLHMGKLTNPADFSRELLKLLWLKELSLPNVQLGDGGGVSIMPGLKYVAPFLTHLNLERTSIGDQTIQGLVTLLKRYTKPALRELNLGGNSLSDDGALLFASLMPVLSQLKILNLSGEQEATPEISWSAGIRAIASQFKKMPLLEVFVCRYHAFENSGAMEVARNLRDVPNLRILDLGGNHITSVSDFVGEFIHTPRLEQFNVSDSVSTWGLSENDLTSIRNALPAGFPGKEIWDGKGRR